MSERRPVSDPPAPPQPSPSLEIANLLERALSLHRQGRLAQAELLYRTILQRAPNHFDALHLLGVIANQRRDFAAAVQFIGQAVQFDPSFAPAHLNLGNALRELKRHREALACYDRALAIRPDYAEALNGRGNALFELRRHREALADYDRALAVKPDYAEALNNRGNALLALERSEEALASYDRALAAKPDDPEILNNRGNALLGLKRHDDALAAYDRALAIKPDHAEAWNQRGNALRGLKRHPDALASYDRALAAKPDHAGALNNRGNALLTLRRPAEALASYERALAIRPDDAEFLNNRGNALLGLKNHQAALASYDRALAAKPADAAIFYNRGNALLDLGRAEEALASFGQALAIKPDYAEAANNRGNVLLELRRYEEAGEEFARLRNINPDYDYAAGNVLSSRLRYCDWQNYDHDVDAIVNDVMGGRRAATPYFFISVVDAPDAQLRCARIYSEDKYAAAGAAIWQRERYDHDKIRIAYLSGEFHAHATTHLMSSLFKLHDRSRFDTIAVSYGPDDKNLKRLEHSFDRFFNVRNKNDLDAASLIKELEIDIAVDLVGLRSYSRSGILSSRPAPIQVNYKGYPGTIGVDYIDYIIADRIVIPEDQHCFYTEKVVYLPDTYQPNDATRPVSERMPTRREAGLPETGFVFCSFNNHYKIVPAVFDVWMRLLRKVAGSVLWLLVDDPTAVRNLQRNAEERGIASDRLVFAPRVKLEEHLARQRLADLFLDTLPHNAHATASDALWAGLPLVTCVGSSFAARVAASLLTAIGLPELVTGNLADYEALALGLALDPPSLAAVKAKLAQGRAASPLFDIDRCRRHLESAYRTMWQRHQRGEPPASFAVAPTREDGRSDEAAPGRMLKKDFGPRL